MTYTKTNWVDQAGQVKYTKSEDGGYWILTPNYEDVSPIGTPVNADNLNHIENGISDCDTAITDLQEDLTDLQEEVTAMYPKIDGQWVMKPVGGIARNVNLYHNPNDVYYVSLADYLPNDGYDYEVIVDGHGYANNDGNRAYCALIVGSVGKYNVFLGNARYYQRTMPFAGNAIIVVGQDRRLAISRHDNYGGILEDLNLSGYRRIGTNE